MSRKKPKFQVGQIVVIEDAAGDTGLVTGMPVRIKSVEAGGGIDGKVEFYYALEFNHAYVLRESRFRAQTAREIGNGGVNECADGGADRQIH